jgi:hypothetical protein
MRSRLSLLIAVLVVQAGLAAGQQGVLVMQGVEGQPPMVRRPDGSVQPLTGTQLNSLQGRIEQPPANCSADGTVVNAVTGEPVPRARVTLGGVTVAADSSGRFQAAGIRCGVVQAFGSRPGFISTGQAAGPPRPMTILEAGGTAHGLRVMLTPHAVITGTVTDDQGDPVMGAQVLVLTSRVQQGKRVFQQSSATNTNDLGEFRLASLAPGRYIVCARANVDVMPQDPRGALSSGEKCYPGPVDGGVASTVELTAGRELRIPMSLPAVAAVHVRGKLTGAAKPRNVSLALVRRGYVAAGGNRGAPVTPDGQFDIRGVTAGSYMLSVDYWEENGRFSARVPIEVGGSDLDGVVVPITQAFSIPGVVRVESSDGAAVPPPKLTLSLRPSEPMAGGGRLVWGPDPGTFTLADLTPGTYRLDSFGNGNFYVKRAMFNGRDISREDVSIVQPGGSIEVVLGNEIGSIEGQIVDRDGAPAAGFVMVVEEGRTPRTSNVTESGNFRIPALAPGTYMVYAWDDVSVVEYADPEWMRRHAAGEKVTLQAGQSAQVKLVRKEAAGQ